MPVLPQEDPGALEERSRVLEDALQPQNDAERLLIHQAARLSYAIERGDRLETAHMSRRVRKAARLRARNVNPRRRRQIRELCRRLLYIASPEEVKINKQPLWTDDPYLLLRQLEDTAEGCRWLLERWEEYRNLLDHKVKWEEGVLIRFLRLQGKPLIESVYDPALNAVFLAWDVLIPKYAGSEWEYYRKNKPIIDPSYNHRLHWHEIASRPSDKDEAWARLYAIVNQRVDRLKLLLARNEAFEAAEAAAPDWADVAALDRSPGAERHRRGQSARSREILQTFNTLCKMRQAGFGMGSGTKADDECQIADDECQTGGGEPGDNEVAGDEWRVASESGVAADPESAVQDPKSDGEPKHESCLGTEKAPNEPKLESTQSALSQVVESENGEPLARERSQSAAVGVVAGGAVIDRVVTIVPAGKGVGNARGREGILLPFAALSQRVCAARGKGPP